MTMTKEELATKLDGREVGDEITSVEADAAKDAGLVVVYGASDDLMEFVGAISDEVGCYDGGFAYLTGNGLLTNDCDNEECPYFLERKREAITIEAVWDDHEYPTWSYSTDIPHAAFGIMEDGNVYCRGIVFSVDDLKAMASCRGDSFTPASWHKRR